MAKDPRTTFIKAATWHGSLDDAVSCLHAYPELATSDIHTAAITGDAEAVRRFLAEDPADAVAVSEPYGGADPNDGEVVYHSPETHDNEVLKLLVESGKLTPESLSLMLLRKHDWHDYEGIKYLLEQGANTNSLWGKGWYALHHALARGNALSIISLLIQYGANPYLISGGLTAIARAAREGRSDVLSLFAQKGILVELEGVDHLIASCAKGDGAAVQVILKQSSWLLQKIMLLGGELLARFCLTDNGPGVNQLLDTEIDVNTPYAKIT